MYDKCQWTLPALPGVTLVGHATDKHHPKAGFDNAALVTHRRRARRHRRPLLQTTDSFPHDLPRTREPGKEVATTGPAVDSSRSNELTVNLRCRRRLFRSDAKSRRCRRPTTRSDRSTENKEKEPSRRRCDCRCGSDSRSSWALFSLARALTTLHHHHEEPEPSTWRRRPRCTIRAAAALLPSEWQATAAASDSCLHKKRLPIGVHDWSNAANVAIVCRGPESR
jgi:hypothetical protein